MDISGVSGRFMVGIDGVESGRLIVGTGGAESGKLIVGIEGVESGKLIVGIGGWESDILIVGILGFESFRLMVGIEGFDTDGVLIIGIEFARGGVLMNGLENGDFVMDFGDCVWTTGTEVVLANGDLNIGTGGKTSFVETAEREIGGLAADTSCEGPGDELEALEKGDLKVVLGGRGPPMVGVGPSFLDSSFLSERIAGRAPSSSFVDWVKIAGVST
jgi:hypothetical protein